MTMIEDQARSIFFETLERAPDQWCAYLDEACSSNVELRARVDQLLLAHGSIRSIHGGPTSTPPLEHRVDPLEGPGTVIGPYRLLQKIGEGGFGIVYMAEQIQPVRRKVALKILKPGMDTRQVIARFEAERQALALMDHPNIAQVFDGGATSTGRPYFVMELVRGIPITEFCDQNLLSVRQRLALFVNVCQAVQHAHQKGIIHRDLKPTNVMVTLHDDKQVVKVIDFGIAKAVGQQLTEKTLFTNFTQMIGTPPYMSPEQAQLSGLDVDTRTDIYALGVLLYELLTGTTPFDQERLRTVAFDEIRRIIREEEPPRPSTRLSSVDDAVTIASTKRGSDPRRLSQLLRGELDWLVMKCLEKDRNRRYETANGLAMDILRYLKNEPVHACPPSLAYKMRLFSRRYKPLLMTVGLFLAVVACGCAITIWQAFQTAAARDAAVKAQLALSETRQHAAEERANTIARDLESLNLANNLVESGLAHADFAEWSKAEADLSKAVKTRPDHSYVWLTRGDQYARLGLWDLAAADFQRAFQLKEPASTRALCLHAILSFYVGDAQGYRRVCERMTARLPEAIDARASAEISRACLLDEHPIIDPERLVQLASQAVNASKTFTRLANLGCAYYRAGQYENALERLREARSANSRFETIWMDSVVAMAHHRLGQPELARNALNAASESLGRRFQAKSENSGADLNAQWWYEAQADIYYREAKRLIQGSKPQDDPRRLCYRGDSLAALGRNQEALLSYSRALEIAPKFETAWSRRAALNARLGNWEQALKDYEQIRSQQPDRAGANNRLAWYLATCPELKLRDSRRAVELAEKAVTLGPKIASCWNTLGMARYRAQNYAGSLKALMKAMELGEGKRSDDWLILAMAEWRLDQKSKAKQLFTHALHRIEAESNNDQELMQIRDEAASLIGLREKPMTLPATGPFDDTSAYTILIEIEPEALWVYGLRGDTCANLRQWDQAAADLARACEDPSAGYQVWYRYAAARLATNDLEGYRRVRSEILSRFAKTQAAWLAHHLLYVSVVLPAQADEAETMIQMANFAISPSPSNPRVRGAANYRAGKYAPAIADLNESAKVFPRRAWDWLFMAMAHYQLGHAEEAKQSMKKAMEWIDLASQNRSGGSASPWLGWAESVEVEHLLREAKALVH
jgi:eukaryotic-like serine/threonine-protein kinase